MPKSSNRRSKPAPSSAIPTVSSPAPSSPFTAPPPKLQPFLSTLDPTHIYVIHIDNHLRNLKQRIFAVPVLLNIAIVAGLLYRAWVAIPVYFEIVVATMGYENAQKVHVKDTPWGMLGGEIAQRAGLFMLDYFLFTILGPWPMDFFIGSPSNPTSSTRWRWRVGFRDTEVVVRRSRKWDEALRQSSKEWASSGAAIERDEGAVMKDRIMPAVSPRWLRDKTGYLMMDKSWDLDFAAMVTAYSLVSTGQCSLPDFRTAVCAHTEGQGWLVWEVWKLEADGEGEEKRRRIVAMKDRLTAMGKENLFFRWVEMV